MSDDLHSLTGAYALGALSHDERERFEAHLADCEPCRAEVDPLLATAARIGAAAAATPPVHLKSRVLAGIKQTPQVVRPANRSNRPAGGHRSPGRAGNMWRNTSLFAAAAVILAVIAIATTTIIIQGGEVDDARARADRVSEVIAAPDAHLIRGEVAGGGTGTAVVSDNQNSAVVVLSGLSPAEPDRTYQLWYIGADHIRSAGTIDLDQPDDVTRVLNELGDTQTLGLTLEPAGGSRQPTTEPVLALELGTPQ